MAATLDAGAAQRPPGADSAPYRWRTACVVFLVIAGWGVLGARLVHLQWYARADFAARAIRQRVHEEAIPARPGDILDRHGRLLATTVRARSLFLIPSQTRDPEGVAERLSDVLGLDARALAERLRQNSERHFLWVQRRLSDEQAHAVRELGLPGECWGFREEYLRQYPQGRLAAHVIGLRDIDGVGRGGIEQSLDPVLRGRDGRRVLLRDAQGRVIEIQNEEEHLPRHGEPVILTLDMVVQLYVERELDAVMETWKPDSACALVLAPETGEVLAMASRPTFDPNQPATVPDAAWKNRTIADIYEPGSTFKPFVVACAVEQGVVRRDEVFHCEHGTYRMGRRLLHDHHAYGELSVGDILVKSSNIGMAKICERLGNEGLYQAAVLFGFGRPTGIELPGELPGILRPLKEWNSYSTGSIPMGHELAATPLQVLSAHAALANEGSLLNPHLVLRQGAGEEAKGEGTGDPRPLVRAPTVSQETARWLVGGPMVEVITRGTGRNAQLKGYEVFGKTGTAQKLDPVTGGYSSDRHVSSFLCGAPADRPQALVLVVVNESSLAGQHYGGTVAAPPAANILKKTLIHLRVPTGDYVPRTATLDDPAYD